MTLGYDGKLYILAFDHRGSFQKKMFGIEGDPTPEQTDQIADAKRLIFEGMEQAVERGVDPSVTGVLVDEQFGSDIPGGARRGPEALHAGREVGRRRVRLRVRRRLPRPHREVRPRLRQGARPLQPGRRRRDERAPESRLKRLADWLHEHDRKFLFELLVPAEQAQLDAVGDDSDRYDRELRPELMRRAIEQLQDYGVEVDIWKIEGVDERADAERLAGRRARARGARASAACCSAAAPPTRRSSTGSARPRRRGLRRLRDRAFDLVGRPQGLPRGRPRPHGGREAGRRQVPALRAGLRRGGSRAPASDLPACACPAGAGARGTSARAS